VVYATDGVQFTLYIVLASSIKGPIFMVNSTALSAIDAMLEELKSDEAIEFLKAEHRAINEGFSIYFLDQHEASWRQAISSALTTLKVHMQLEEEIIYPQYASDGRYEERLDESMIEHGLIKNLIADIEHSDPADEQYDAMVRVLWRMVAAHIADEEGPDGVYSRRLKNQPADLAQKLSMRRDEILGCLASTRSP
jgi:hypothetical protein